MDMISAGITGLVFILLVVFTVLSAKTWHWLNIVFVNLTFLAGVAATIGLSQALHLRQQAMQELDTARVSAEKNQKAADLAVFGRPNSSSYDRDSLRGKAHEMALVLTGRGRVWTGGSVTVEEENRVFKFSAARPEEQTNQVKIKDVLLYVFADGDLGGQLNAQGRLYPQSYVGSVMVTEEAPEKVTLKPVFIANPQEWTEPATTWSLFEKMPLDRHDTFQMGIVAFADANSDQSAPEFKEFAQSILSGEMQIGPYREILQSNYLKPELFGLEPASREYEALLDRFAFDGFPMGKIQTWIDQNAGPRVSKRFEPDPEEVYVRYRFNQESKSSYKVDSDAGTLETDGPFTELGLAVDKGLHSASPDGVKFSKGDTLLVDLRTALGQRGNEQVTPFDKTEDVTEMERIYVRQLRDFPYMFSDVNSQTTKFMAEAARVRTTIVVQEQALADAQSQLDDRLATFAGLKQDNEHMKVDLGTIETSFEARQQDITRLEAQVSSLRNEIEQSYNRIQSLTRRFEQPGFSGS